MVEREEERSPKTPEHNSEIGKTGGQERGKDEEVPPRPDAKAKNNRISGQVALQSGDYFPPLSFS